MFRILYIADGRLHQIGPFDTEREAIDSVKEAQSTVEFDINEQCVYLCSGECRIVELGSSDIEN